MLAKLLSLLSTAKGAAAASVIAAAGVTGGVAVTNEDVQHAITTTVQNVTQQTPASPSVSPKGAAAANASPSSQPPVIAARNDADKKLRDAFQDDQQKLEKLRGTQVQGADREQLNTLVTAADTRLRARLTLALDDVAALTLGREGLRTGDTPRPSASPRPSPSAPASTSPLSSSSPDVRLALTADAQLRIDAIVTAAITDMNKIAADAVLAAAALPTFSPGKPHDLPGARPSDTPGAKPSDVPGGGSSAAPSVPATAGRP